MSGEGRHDQEAGWRVQGLQQGRPAIVEGGEESTGGEGPASGGGDLEAIAGKLDRIAAALESLDLGLDTIEAAILALTGQRPVAVSVPFPSPSDPIIGQEDDGDVG